MSMVPSQKIGMVIPMLARTVTKVSIDLPRLMAQTTPAGIPIRKLIRKAGRPKLSVIGTALEMMRKGE
jgi:hypothetical protein